MDDNFKRLVKELGYAINESLSDSEKIADVMGRIRASGYDLYLVLEVTIGFNKRDDAGTARRQKPGSGKSRTTRLRLTNQDTQFLRALKISVEE